MKRITVVGAILIAVAFISAALLIRALVEERDAGSIVSYTLR